MPILHGSRFDFSWDRLEFKNWKMVQQQLQYMMICSGKTRNCRVSVGKNFMFDFFLGQESGNWGDCGPEASSTGRWWWGGALLRPPRNLSPQGEIRDTPNCLQSPPGWWWWWGGALLCTPGNLPPQGEIYGTPNCLEECGKQCCAAG